MSKLDQLRALREQKAKPKPVARKKTGPRQRRFNSPGPAIAPKAHWNSATPTPSTHCQSCGKRLIAMTGAEKQRNYRERKKARPA